MPRPSDGLTACSIIIWRRIFDLLGAEAKNRARRPIDNVFVWHTSRCLLIRWKHSHSTIESYHDSWIFLNYVTGSNKGWFSIKTFYITQASQANHSRVSINIQNTSHLRQRLFIPRRSLASLQGTSYCNAPNFITNISIKVQKSKVIGYFNSKNGVLV